MCIRDSAIAGFDVVKQGMTLKNTVNATGGVTSTNFRYWGTASNADKLGGFDSSAYLKAGDANFTALAEFADVGLAVGDSNDFRIKVENGNEAVIETLFFEKIPSVLIHLERILRLKSTITNMNDAAHASWF